MKIAAINGSPKGEASNSREVISILQKMLDAETEWTVVTQIAEDRKRNDNVLPSIFESDVLLITFPLYVDGLPASLMRLMERYAAHVQAQDRARGAGSGSKRQRVFAVANCGFYEGVQNECALKMIAHFCEDTGLAWCGGAGFGTGEMIRELKTVPPEAGIRKPITGSLKAIADAIAEGPGGKLEKNIYAQHAFPWLAYKLCAEAGWRAQAKKNGLKRSGIHARPLETRPNMR